MIHQMQVLAVILFCICLLGCQTKNQNSITENRPQNLEFIDMSELTNDFFDNVEVHDLPVSEIRIDGEVGNPGLIKVNEFPMRSVIVKETGIDGDKTSFVGAYKYEGYSLKDILNRSKIKKKNLDEFNPIIDLFVIVSNSYGEKAVFSWGELFYPVHQDEIILATRVMQIVPSKSKELWPLPDQARIIVAADLLTERNLIDPTVITVKSLNRSFEVDQNIDTLYSDHIDIVCNGSKVGVMLEYPSDLITHTYPTIFYGRGKGIHGVSPFKGVLLKDYLFPYTEISKHSLTLGMITISAIDGYRVAFSFSEMFNRNDQAEVLLINRGGNQTNGKFSIFPAADFFSDRAIKAIDGIYFDIIDD